MMAARVDQKGLLLGDLLAGIADVADYARCVVYGIATDSREVTSGGLFLALAGLTTHGMQHLQQAIEQGALAVLAEPAGDWDRVRLARAAANSAVPVIMVTSLSQQVGVIASRFFGQPSQGMRVIGVTGTNGKTSVTHFLANVLAQRVPTGILGTLGNGRPGKLLPSSHTTLDAVGVQAELARQLAQGVKVAAMEVSSHALDQGRVNGVAFHTAVFTNLSRDHQDYHRNMQAYAEAKARLFRRAGLMLAVVNGDDQAGAQLLQELRRRTLAVAVGSRSDAYRQGDRFIAARRLLADDRGLTIAFESSWGSGEVRSPLLGRFNAENLLLTLGVLLGWEMPMSTALDALQSLPPVEGRMALYGGGELPRVVVDYAHTPDALEKVLSSLREHVRGLLICVFGCGGERDRGKRPLMGEVAQRLADRVLITDDNPRREDGDAIVTQILDGMRQDRRVSVQRDRARAILEAVTAAGQDDLVLVAGKGHEDYQLVGDLRLDFSDREQVLSALREYPA